MTRPTERRIMFGLFLLFTVVAYGACYFTISKALDVAIVVMAGTWE